jgi:tRNA A-37 threonylcarbamoyl transferase component Bud32
MNDRHDVDGSSRRSGPVVPADDATVISNTGGAEAQASTLPPAAFGGRSTTTAEIGALLGGTMLGPYRLDEFVGGGGMGAVFRALDTTLDRTVAVKVLARRQSDDEETLRRFRNEAQSAARLDHENIGRVHAVGSEGDWHYIVFEFIEGTNIRDLVREEGPFDSSRTIDVAIQVADALEHASEREIVHRDIKPSNIVITPAGRARIVDMGLARLHQVEGDVDLTVSGMTLGTFDYISPEQARDPRAADVRSDLYSLGCTMFFMLVGRPPFAEGTMVQKLLQHQQAAPPVIDEIRPEVPRRLAAVVERLMEKDPLDRYQRPAVLVADLLACADAEGYAIASPRPGAAVVAAEPPAESRLPWLIPALVLAVTVGLLWLRSASERRSGGVAPSQAVSPMVAAEPPTNPEASTVRRVTTATEFSAAVEGLAEDRIVELDWDGPLEAPAVEVAGRRLEIRAAAGRQPVLRLSGSPEGSGMRVRRGSLVVRGVGLHVADAAVVDGRKAARRSLVTVLAGRFECEGSVLRMPDGEPPAGEPQAAAFFTVAGQDSIDAEIVLTGVRAAGGGDLFQVAASGGGRIVLRWDGGAASTPGHLLSLEGSRTTVAVECGFEDLVAACGAGLVVSRDAASLPLPARLTMQASGCRFVVTDPTRPFIECSGIATPAEYAAAMTWQDRHGRYEGGAAFLRIDGSAERVEQAFGEAGLTLVHDALVGSLPQPATWPGWGL